VQPLVLRAVPGECVRIALTNRLDDPASVHIHASTLVIAGTRQAATAANPDSLAVPGGRVEYEWQLPEDEPEGTHVVHSHGDPRFQSGHGLFGTFVVEPPGAEWLDPRTGEAGTSGWDAVIRTPTSSFREFVLAYHEIGDEDYRIPNTNGGALPQVDPLTNAYRPGGRAINYRSEPFYNRLQLGKEQSGIADESVAYSSYAFGDPATPILRSYVGDPVKERLVHAGAEVFHVHHVHGGSVRWRRQPGAGPTDFGTGLDKHPDLLPGASERTDSQSIGPSESFDIDHECSAGGCQQGAGDYLVHCHIAQHYFAGMWGIWRVYNTLQDGVASTDALGPLPALAERADDLVPAVDSSHLAPDELETARRHLPPRGVPGAYDASVWDWTEEGGRIVGEPETTVTWPGYSSATPGVRPPVLFDPATARPAYPMLRPHLGRRPPFAPDHGPAPYFDTPMESGELPPPGADGLTSLCPQGTQQKSLDVRAIEVPIPLNESKHLVDPAGMLFVLGEDEAKVRADPSAREPLAVRANAAEDCVDVLFTNEVPDNANHPFSKVSAHIHFVQFDVQAGDGVDTGFNYEQTVRPFAESGGTATEAIPSGAGSVVVDDASTFGVGGLVGVDLDDHALLEIRRVVAIDGNRVSLDRPLDNRHPAGAVVSAEFVRYRWYPDAQVGTSYFHDHVNGVQTWQHGLVGALIVEPPGSTYHDPSTGAEIGSGAIADIHVPGDAPVSADVRGSFREWVCFLQDGSKLTNVERSPGSNISFRAEPLDRRQGDPASVLSSRTHGDPATPLIRAYVGDPVVVRATVSGTNEVHTWHLDGHWFRREAWSTDSAPTSTARLGISERMDLSIPAAGGPQQRAGDYLYSNGRALKLREGAWGLFRIHAASRSDLQPLPGHAPAGRPPPLCPAAAPVRRFDLAAVQVRLPMLAPQLGQAFVPLDQADVAISGDVPVEPLVVRAAVGDCLELTLENRLPQGADAVSIHADGLAYDPLDSGLEVGENPANVVPVGERHTYRFFVHPEYGTGAALLRDGGDLADSAGLGLYGAVAIAPEGATFDREVGSVAMVTGRDGEQWRDAVLFMQDSDDAIGTHRMPYTTRIRGAAALNYGLGPSAPRIHAYAGEPLRLHVVAPWSEQVQVFALEGHRWPVEPLMQGSSLVGSTAIGGLESLTLVPVGGAGGEARLTGTYAFGNHREAFREAGIEGELIVHDACREIVPRVPPLAAVAGACNGGGGSPLLPVGVGAIAVAAAVAAYWLVRRRRT
ncbi:MAG: multicopper oxidase domain-containing protein, partial [Acidimicrobiales bacterium]